MRRFDTPTAPPGWAGQGAELLRIVDPTGRAIAWLAPGFGASCVGYAVREAGPAPGRWRQVFASGGPRALLAGPLAHGCAILGPEPAGVGNAHRARWRFVERDPTAATCAVRCGDVALTLTAALEDAALQFDLRATNVGDEPLPLALGLRFCLAEGIGARTADGHPPRFAGHGLTLGILPAPGAPAPVRWHVEETAPGRFAAEARGATLAVAPGGACALALALAPG